MPIYQVTRILRNGDSGWSESYWTEQASASGAFAAALALNNAVRQLQVPSVRLDALRISLAGERMSATHVDVPVGERTGASPDIGGVIQHMNLAPDAALITIRTAIWRHKNRKFLRGIPDNAFQFNGLLLAAVPDFLARLNGPENSVLTTLIAQNFRVRTRQRAPLTGFVYTTITAITVERATTRRVGRPFGLPVGRRRRRRPLPIPAALSVTGFAPATPPGPDSTPMTSGSHPSSGIGASPEPSSSPSPPPSQA